MTKQRACTALVDLGEREEGLERARQGKARQGEARQASREASDPTKVGCYLTILVKRSRHYTIGLDPESRSVTDRERCQASHSDCLHRRETRHFASFRF